MRFRRASAVAGMVLLLAFGGAAKAVEQNSGAIGQIVPSGGVVTVGGEPGAVVAAIRVKPGDTVKAGDVLMTLESEALKSDRDQARSEFQSAKKLGDSQVAAQNLAVELARQRLVEATRQLAAYRSLGDRSVSANESARLESVETQAKLSLQIEEAKQDSTKIDADKSIQAAAKRLASANTSMELRAPSDGTILKIDRRVGQRLGNDPAVQMGDLSTMYVTCQVYEGDLLRLKPGMKATVKSATLTTPISGTIEEVGRIVDTRSRLGDIRIRLDNPEPANRLVGMEVEVVIAR
jgi:HlyD family secretion protein